MPSSPITITSVHFNCYSTLSCSFTLHLTLSVFLVNTCNWKTIKRVTLITITTVWISMSIYIVEHNNNIFYFQDYFPYQGCLPFVGTGWNDCWIKCLQGFSKIRKQTEGDGAYHLQWIWFPIIFFLLIREWKPEKWANGKEISMCCSEWKKGLEYLWR